MINNERLHCTASDFQKEMKSLVMDGHNYLDALVAYQTRHGLDEYAMSHLLSKSKAVLSNLVTECHDLHLLDDGKRYNKLR